MLEGLAIWALLIYVLRLIGMPWNAGTKAFAYIGGSIWLGFVWLGLFNWNPMDLSGGSYVQSPHIQLRPASTQVTGEIKKFHIEPNSTIKKGQLVYELDDERYVIARDQAQAKFEKASAAVRLAEDDVRIAEATTINKYRDIEVLQSQLEAAKADLKLQSSTNRRYVEQNKAVPNTITESAIETQEFRVANSTATLKTLISQIKKAEVEADKAKSQQVKAMNGVVAAISDAKVAKEALSQAQWNLDATKVYAPQDGYVTNFISREGQFVGILPRVRMYTNEKYVMMRVNHQAIRNIDVGYQGEFASPVYPAKVFQVEVEGIVEATGESSGSLLSTEDKVRNSTGQNLRNKHHFVRLKLTEPEGYDIPVGSVGLAWVSGDKPHPFLNFLDVIRGIIIRIKAQIYYIYSI
ncbi:HlyD family secretion protein [Vibrio crassostreae]|uniref:HlyD family secretion protein n=1 Tax=Vibrio crassostreae TaxID=246167 RepID=UPI001B31140C|nr:biotin/lipoyl-binding protein [Vibrio crassostreae]